MDNEFWLFDHFCPLKKRWIRARYRARKETIAERYAPGTWRTVGQPEIRAGRVEDTFTGNFGPSTAGRE